MSEMTLGWMLMGYGLIGVFTVLIVFYATIRLLVRLFPHRETPAEPGDKIA